MDHNLDDNRRYVAFLLGYDPNRPKTWPLSDFLDRLITIERRNGHAALLIEIRKLTDRPSISGAARA